MHTHDVGPIYCETFLIAEGAQFPLEWVNALTSVIPILFGIWALVWLWERKFKNPELYALAALAALTGFGSVLWHGLRTPLSLTLDALPGVLYFLLFVYLWAASLGGRRWGYGTVIGLLGSVVLLTQFVPFPDVNGPPAAVFAMAAIFALFLLVWTYRKAGHAVWLGIAMIASTITAVTFRTIDLSLCDTFPFGVHFLWHTFLGAAAFLGVLLIASIYRRRSER